MSDSFAFRSKINGFTEVVFGVSLQDAKQCINYSSKNIEYLGKNLKLSNSTLARVTEKQTELNRQNFDRIMKRT